MVKKTFRWLGNILVVLLLFLSVSSFYSVILSKKHPGEIPSILGYKVMTVLSGSMEPQLEPGDLIVVKAIDPKKAQVNDVITYRKGQNTLVTHRIVEIVNKDGVEFFTTKGDANNVQDQDLVSFEQVVGSPLIHIPKAGYVANFLKSSAGFILLLLFPLLILFIGVFKKILSINREEKKGSVKV